MVLLISVPKRHATNLKSKFEGMAKQSEEEAKKRSEEEKARREAKDKRDKEEQKKVEERRQVEGPGKAWMGGGDGGG